MVEATGTHIPRGEGEDREPYNDEQVPWDQAI